MYNYILDVTASNKKIKLPPAFDEDIKIACKDANSTTNAKRYGREFSFISRIDSYTIRLHLKTGTPVIATRAISSITRALIRIDQKELSSKEYNLSDFLYNGSILNATIVEENEEASKIYSNLVPHEIVQSVIEIFFGQNMLRNKDKEIARIAAEKIKDIVIDYKNHTLNT